MEVKAAYSQWAAIYDTNKNRTRDLEALALRQLLQGQRFLQGLELGCGTGKNTEFLAEICEKLTALDITPAMLAQAQQKVQAKHVEFRVMDLLETWDLPEAQYDLAVFSLVLEHIQDLAPIFQQLYECLRTGGMVYIGELHPFKQYTGTQARFETEQGVELVPCYLHHVSDFVGAATAAGFQLKHIAEQFDEGERNLPRILNLLFTKP
jgi:ubiquinone/menaquinone biosynthesis C-methylase UbiE